MAKRANVNPSRTTVAEMSAARAARHVINLRNQGYPRERVIEALRQRFPNAPIGSIRAMVDRGDKAAEAGARMEGSAGNERLTGAQVPVRDTGCTHWRYWLVAQITNSEGEAERDVPHEVVSPISLTEDELHSATREAVASQIVARVVGSPPRAIQETATVRRIWTIGVERYCQ